jgi:hypothetical protein
MKKLLIAVACSLLVALTVSGLWGARAVTQRKPTQVSEMTNLTLASNMTMRNMTMQSDLIVIGECVNTQTSWVDRRIVTLATVRVSEALKGSPSSEVTVMLPGGIDVSRKIPISMNYPGAPRMQANEEVALFLKSTGLNNSYGVMGYSQGKFSIVQNDQGQKMVAQDLTKVQLKSGTGVTRGTLRAAPLSLFREQIREYLR